jgi:hypothetical protein
VVVDFIFQRFETPLADLGLANRLSCLQVGFEDGQNPKDVFLFRLELPLGVRFHQFLQLLSDYCKFQRKVVLTSQDLYDLAKT